MSYADILQALQPRRPILHDLKAAQRELLETYEPIQLTPTTGKYLQ